MRRLLVASILVVGGLSALPHAAAASCARPLGAGGATTTLQARLAEAPAVFVGTVASTRNNARVARVQVESVWKGSPIPSRVTVSGTPDQSSAATSVDRTFRAGERYLFAPSSATSPFQDTNCSATQPWSPDLAVLKPAAAVPPSPGSDGLEPTGLAATPVWIPAGVAVVILVAGAAAWLLHRPAVVSRAATPDGARRGDGGPPRARVQGPRAPTRR
ncbi:MAG: hypothetical protein NVSMB29_20010 [Candidatus Dormibacteria bacterium]